MSSDRAHIAFFNPEKAPEKSSLRERGKLKLHSRTIWQLIPNVYAYMK